MLAIGLLWAGAALAPDTSAALQSAARARIARDSGAVVAVVLDDPGSGLQVSVNPALRFHAASTMKLGVLIELGHRIEARERHWNDSLAGHNSFASIVEVMPDTLDPSSANA